MDLSPGSRRFLRALRTTVSSGPDMLSDLMKSYSIEITARDHASRRAVLERMPPGSEVFIADLPDQPPDVMREAAAELRQAGLEPVPHLVARNVTSREEIAALFGYLCDEVRVSRVLITGGDRQEPAGPFASALEVIQSGILSELGLSRLAFPCYPEGHPRIAEGELTRALDEKLTASPAAGTEVVLISQFAFDAAPVLEFVRSLRDRGIKAPLRVGTAGPAERQKLIEFGRDLGAGPSLQRLEGAGGSSETETPEQFLTAIARATEREPSLGIAGVHLFPFGSVREFLKWAEAHRCPRP